MKRQFNNNKKSLSYMESVKSWKRGQKTKIINEPSKAMLQSTRNGIILT